MSKLQPEDAAKKILKEISRFYLLDVNFVSAAENPSFGMHNRRHTITFNIPRSWVEDFFERGVLDVRDRDGELVMPTKAISVLSTAWLGGIYTPIPWENLTGPVVEVGGVIASPEPYTTILVDRGWMIHYAGNWWFSKISPSEAVTVASDWIANTFQGGDS